MKIYSPSDIANLLHIKVSTLRKYSIMLENVGYEFQKNDRKQRYYQDEDVIALQKLITLKDNGMTLDESVKGVVLWYKGNESNDNDITLHQTDTRNVTERDVSDITQLKEMIQNQNQLIGELSKRLDKQQEFLDKRLTERDQKLMHAINQSLETQKQIAATRQKKWWQLWK